ncbi:hypothetical protein SELMODRAFT_411084 [Selaginella moellendorffii]|uniref:Crinkler (CRN) family protein n=1 Tax=Selaginella moellendorffii TaxID=88036 RepID=D8RGJ1_SELML|nr:hypothetical protein SELMODRAFT_411084 [Selaginella moellendorffii]
MLVVAPQTFKQLLQQGEEPALGNVIGSLYGKYLASLLGGRGWGYSGSGDVKYHLGTSYNRPTRTGKHIHLSFVVNPSHLEAVDPVVATTTRGRRTWRFCFMEIASLATVMLHLSDLPNYTTEQSLLALLHGRFQGSRRNSLKVVMTIRLILDGLHGSGAVVTVKKHRRLARKSPPFLPRLPRIERGCVSIEAGDGVEWATAEALAFTMRHASSLGVSGQTIHDSRPCTRWSSSKQKKTMHHVAMAVPDPVRVITALEQVKVEVCNQVKVDKGAPPAQAKLLDLPNDLSEGWWSAGKPNRKLLVRSCYDPIFNLVWKHNEVEAESLDVPNPGVVLLGNPGIGKTRGNIIIKLPTMDDYVFVTWENDQLKVDKHSEVPNTLNGGGEGVSWWFLLTCSPKKANYYEFAKTGNVRMLFDPVWTEDELLALNEHNFGHDPEEVRKRFLGTPRYVLEKVWPEAQAEISRAIGLAPARKAFHTIVDESTFTSCRLAPASAYVEEQLLSNLPLPGLKRFLSVEQPDGVASYSLGSCNKMGKFGPVLVGSFPEVAPRYHLERSGTGHEAVFPQQILLDYKNALFKPSSARNTEWDFIVNGNIYQVTVTKKRALVLRPAVEKALDFLRVYYSKEKQVDFCILVPLFNLTAFAIDWFDTINPEKRKDKHGMVNEVMDSIKKLNVKVKLVLLDIGGICVP